MTTTTTAAAPAPAEPSGFSLFLRRLRGNGKAMAGLVIVTIVVFVAIFAPWLAPDDPNRVALLDAWAPPSPEHWLGTDELGRDILSRLIMGARVSLSVAIVVLAISLVVGTTIGICSAWYRGRIDGMLMRFVDVVLAFPELIIALLVAAVLGMGLTSTIVALSLVSFPSIARLARSLALGLRGQAYMDAAILSGATTAQVMRRHILPNIVSPLIVRASLGVSLVIMAEASLSFLGIGVQEPAATWGGMIRDGLPHMATAPTLTLSASFVLAATLIGFNLLGDGLRDVIDPRNQR